MTNNNPTSRNGIKSSASDSASASGTDRLEKAVGTDGLPYPGKKKTAGKFKRLGSK